VAGPILGGNKNKFSYSLPTIGRAGDGVFRRGIRIRRGLHIATGENNTGVLGSQNGKDAVVGMFP